MWDYSEKLLDHFHNPRNVGVVDQADGVGEVGSLACGDALKLTFKLDKSGRIADAKFQTFGCASAIASSSTLTEIIKGMTLEEAERVTNRDIARFLGGLPEQKMHCSVMGREALEAAIKNYRSGGGEKKELEGKVVCTCFGVTEKEIERVVKENDLTSVEEVTNYTKAGGGCGGCLEEIRDIISRVGGTPVPPESPLKRPPRRLTNVRKIQLIQETIDREIRPSLRKDGGELELVDVIGNTVVISFRGVCTQCRAAGVTAEQLVQAKLREFVSPELEVREEE